MKDAFAFGGGLLTVFGALTFLSVLLAISGATQHVAGDELLLVVWAVVSSAVMASAGAISFFLGIKRFGPPSASARLYLLGVGSALAMYVAFVLLSTLQQLLPESSHVILQYAVTFLVCFLAAFTARARAG